MSTKSKYSSKNYRNRYTNNEEFREMKRKLARERYVPKCVRCVECSKRWNKSLLEEVQYQYSKDDFHCPECTMNDRSTPVKSKRGRPRKDKTVAESFQTLETDSESEGSLLIF